MFLSNLLALLVLAAFVLYMNRYQIAPEERALEARFGEDYRHYGRSVRRWLTPESGRFLHRDGSVLPW